MNDRIHVVVMGVSANGKTSVGQQLADHLDATFIEGDDLHPRANIEKMSAGTPLTDEDRWPWLGKIASATSAEDKEGRSTVTSCSALKHAYRDVLRATPGTFFVHLHGPFNLIAERIRAREGHFMPPGLLLSQFETLEPLGEDEAGVLVDVSPPLNEVVAAAIAGVEDHRRATGSARRPASGTRPAVRRG